MPPLCSGEGSLTDCPYVSFMGANLTNRSYVDLNPVGEAQDGSDSVQCHTDLSTCCGAAQGADHGDWFFPNESRLPIPLVSVK